MTCAHCKSTKHTTEKCMFNYVKPDNFVYLECPACGKYAVDDREDWPLVCKNCKDEYTEDDMCMECNKLVKGGCYYCKMD